MEKTFRGRPEETDRQQEQGAAGTPDDLVSRAALFAAEAHRGVKRKQGQPYILHPMEVAVIISTMTDDPHVIAAGLLHDVVEDTPHTAEEIREQFGDRVAALVAAETENKRANLPPEQTWKIRKEESLEELRATEDDAVRILWLADKLSNIRSLRRMLQAEGEKTWTHFHMQDIAEQAWYYRTIAEALSQLRDTDAWQEYVQLVGEVFGEADGETK